MLEPRFEPRSFRSLAGRSGRAPVPTRFFLGISKIRNKSLIFKSLIQISDDSLGLHQVKVKLSGLYYNPSSGIAPLKFIFGTFMTVLLTIAIIFVIYYPVRDIK